jgi:hypothetical protein
MFGARLSIFHWGTETLPEDTDEDIAAFDFKDGINETLRSFGVKAGIGIRFLVQVHATFFAIACLRCSTYLHMK